MPPNLELKNSAFSPYIGIAEKANTEIFRQYQRILENTEIFPVNNIVRLCNVETWSHTYLIVSALLHKSPSARKSRFGKTDVISMSY